MHYGEQVTLTELGILISAKELELIGIADHSRCWGVWLPEWLPTSTDSPRTPHLLISPFHPNTWPALFRITLKLDDSQGSLRRAADSLASLGLNIISHNCAPSGHSHATLNVLAYSPEVLKTLSNLGFSPTTFHQSTHDRSLINPDLRRRASTEFATLILSASVSIERSILEAHAADAFLRETFLLPDQEIIARARPGKPRGLAFEPTLLREYLDEAPLDVHGRLGPPSSTSEVAARNDFLVQANSVPAVSCTWLQYPAFFWLYGENPVNPILFAFDAARGLLAVDPTSRDVYTSRIPKVLESPIKTITSLDTQAHYVRVILSDAATSPHLSIKVRYKTAQTSLFAPAGLGLLATLSRAIETRDINLRRLSNRILCMGDRVEAAEICFVGAPHTLSIESRDEIKHGIMDAASKHRQVILEHVAVDLVGAEKIFVSSRAFWLHDTRQYFTTLLRKRLAADGFEMDTSPGLDPGIRKSVTDDAVQRILASDGLLQIIPKFRGWDKGGGKDSQWLLYELGVARGAEKLCEICVDAIDEDELNKWREVLKVSRDRVLWMFNGEADSSRILDAIEKGIQALIDQMQARVKT